jgi:manganese/zinc/iron transport system permease protein
MDSHQYINPYSGQAFLGFFLVLFKRVSLFFSGELSYHDLAADEIQILVLFGITLSSALLGAFLVFRKMTMIANSLSHTILIGIAFAYLMQRYAITESLEIGHTPPTGMLYLAAIATGITTCFLTEFLTKKIRLQEDASIGIVFTTFFALGIILVTLFSRNAHIGTEILMGNVDALQLEDVSGVWVVAAVNFILCFLFFKEYMLLSFDLILGKLLAIPSSFFNYLLLAQVSITIIGAFRAVGIILVLAFITGPVLAARFFTFDMKKLIFFAVLIGLFASLIGVAIARHCLSIYSLAISTGGCVVSTIALIFTLSVIYSKTYEKIRLQP